ncbi:hypothetical protein LIER_30314 [Lithospermum erythrorhizon]|uniref:Uncharacterized protein n=1 Tax=Lithospermum erythrorhizon TaxID=34254 RepID=A0AAV3RR88_LITER
MESLGVESNVLSCGEMEEMKLDEIYWLKHEKEILKDKIEKVRKEEEETRAHIEALEKRLEATEMCQKQIMSLLAKAIEDPALLMEFVGHEETGKIEGKIVRNK